MLDWLIIGGGIHGTHLSLVLTQLARVPYDRIGVLDPYPEPLTHWHNVTTATGMTFLRSPIVHHLHYDQRALGIFARIHDTAPYTRFIPTYNRPSLELFNRHSQYVIEKYKLASLRLQGKAGGLTRLSDGWRVETAEGGLEAKRVVLAMGSASQPNYPEWAQQFMQSGIPGPKPVHHIFDTGFQLTALPPEGEIVVIGGGITAGQVALALCQIYQGQITIVMRHPIRIHDFDSDPGWMNAIYLRDFHKIVDLNQRRSVIRTARHPGSMPPDIAQALQQAVHEGHIRIIQAEVRSAIYQDSQVLLTLDQGEKLQVAQVLLATGYALNRPGGEWLNEAIQRYNLPVAACGFPIIDRGLSWHPGLFVSGALAELEIGPAARNIIGARMTGQQLMINA